MFYVKKKNPICINLEKCFIPAKAGKHSDHMYRYISEDFASANLDLKESSEPPLSRIWPNLKPPEASGAMFQTPQEVSLMLVETTCRLLGLIKAPRGLKRTENWQISLIATLNLFLSKFFQ